MLVTNNHTSFHLWWKENLPNHEKVSKYDKHDRLENILLLIVENSRILAGIYFAFLKKRTGPNLKGFQYQIWISVKILGK